MTHAQSQDAKNAGMVSKKSETRDMPTFGTFHSFYFWILRIAYGYSANQVVSDSEKYKIATDLIKKYKIETNDIKSLATNILDEIALIKEERIDIDKYYSANTAEDSFRDIYKDYEKQLGLLHKIDYEDMLLMTYELLHERDDIRKACERRFRYILVDEFQDINQLQFDIIKMIAGDCANITIVGDDDQSIYRFRGAKPEIMLGFEGIYPTCKKIILDANFRSTDEIVSESQRLIHANTKRFEKKIYAARGAGIPVKYMQCLSVRSEARYVIDSIKKAIQDEVPLSEMAVLYRTNIQPRILTEELMRLNIPFMIHELPPDIMDHWVCRDIRSYLDIAAGTGVRSDVIRIMNHPLRYIKRDAARMIPTDSCDIAYIKRYYKSTPWMLDRVCQLEKDVRKLGRLKVQDAINYIRYDMGYEDYLRDYAKEHKILVGDLIEILDELHESSEGHDSAESWYKARAEYREKILKEIADRKNEGSTEAVHLMTFHSSKGLEFRIVFIIDANDKVTPYRKAKTLDEIEEERRMFYVAMTRAKDDLRICVCKRRFQKEATISPFVMEASGKSGK